ncbi:SH3 domain-containing protein [Saezia sanguinis]|uniref:SH3 domain-containing protein n=1 Tax=Saezia sanguinis TaxID=1965230 RepID=UPI00302E99A1
MKFIAIGMHRSEFPEPITFAKGALLVIGEKYEGPEGWDNWYFCSTADQQEGWIPGQIIEWIDTCNGKAVEDYTASELDTDEGDVLTASKSMNGWAWCCRASDGQSGWVPLEILRKIDE